MDFARQELYPDTTRTGLWMHNAVPRMFNVCRIPQANRDRLAYAQPSSPYRKKVVVSIRDWIYSLDVYDGDRRSICHHEIERRLRDIVLDAESRVRTGESGPAVGVLTADERNAWAKVSAMESMKFCPRYLFY